MRLSVALLSFMLLGQTPYMAPEWTPATSKGARPAYYSRVVATHTSRGLQRFAWYEVPHVAAYSPEGGCLFVSSDALPHPPPELDPMGITSIGVFCGIRELCILAGERDVIADSEETRDE